MPDGSFVRAQIILGTNVYRDVLHASLEEGIPMSQFIEAALKEHIANAKKKTQIEGGDKEWQPTHNTQR